MVSALGGQVTVAWDPNSESDLAGYNLYVREGSSQAVKMAAQMKTAVTVSNLMPAKTYYFYATAYNTKGVESEPSATLSYTVPSPGGMKVLWQPSLQPGIVGYNLYHGKSGQPATKAIMGNATSMMFDKLAAGATYYFYPAGYNSVGMETQYYPTVTYKVPTDPSQIQNELYIPTENLSVPTAVTYVGLDSTTKGSWKGKYGVLGMDIAGDAKAYPSGLAPILDGSKTWIWSNPSLDTSALTRKADSQRIAAAYYSTSSFTFRFPFADDKTRRLSVYCLDFQNAGISQVVEVLHPMTGTVLASKTISKFTEGVYVKFDVKGRVTVRVRRTAGTQAVVSGVFFDQTDLIL